MKKKKGVSLILSFILIGIVLYGMWYLYPFSKFGAMVVYDHVQAHMDKSHVEDYVRETYGEKMDVKSFSYDGEARINMLVASVYEKERHATYSIYYDIKENKVLFDEFQLEKQGNPYLNELYVSAGGEKAQKDYLEKAVEEQEKMIKIYEKEIGKALVEDQQKLTILETHIEKEYENLGLLKNALDSLSLENRG